MRRSVTSQRNILSTTPYILDYLKNKWTNSGEQSYLVIAHRSLSNLVFSDCLLEFDLLLLLSLLEDLRRNFIIGMIRYNTNWKDITQGQKFFLLLTERSRKVLDIHSGGKANTAVW